MLSVLALLFLATLVCAQGTHYLYGPQWGWYSIRTSGYILSAETTLHPNAPPSPAQQRLALWPGMNTAMGLIQPIIVSSDEGYFTGRQCGGSTTSQWCVFASMIKMRQEAGARVPLNGDEALRMKFVWNETLNGYNQWLYIKDKMVSQLHIPTGKARSFYVDTECQSRHRGVVNNHTILNSNATAYTDTTIVFSEPVPNLDKTIGVQHMACADSIRSSDNGRTWNIPVIRVDRSNAPDQFVRGVKMSVTNGGLCGR